MLVAVFMLFVVGAMAALSIDVVTLYTARSEAQLAADGAALAAARVLANSGATSDQTGTLLNIATSATGPAKTVAIQVATQNLVGGTNLTSSNVTVAFGNTTTPPYTNPTVTVKVQASLPTFFARIWGTTQVAIAASATAEAYNPTPGPSSTGTGTPLPVAPICVKPWVLPNIDPNITSKPIFDPTTGAIQDQALLGWTWTSTNNVYLTNACAMGTGDCTAKPPAAWAFYPGETSTTFQPPAKYPTCAPALTTAYEQSIGGCVPAALACNGSADILKATHTGRTVDAVNCLTHAASGGGDTVTVTSNPPSVPFEFVPGADNPMVLAGAISTATDIMVSDSLVTVPVYNSTASAPPFPGPLQIIGFVQLFLNPNGQAATIGSNGDQVMTTVINMAGCGTSATGQPILGNGASPVAVRLISPP
ncbi:MAG: pilus assembly protein TadG-related protein [Terriglobales bacterium]